MRTTWGALFVKALAKKLGRPVVGINFSLCGGVLYNMIQRADLVLKFKPDLMIVNFGYNDEPTPDLYFNIQMKQFLDKILPLKTNLLFSIEALSFETHSSETSKALLIAKHLQEHNLSYVSLHRQLGSPELRDGGLLWQDHVHFTDFGHRLASQFFINTDSVKKLTSK